MHIRHNVSTKTDEEIDAPFPIVPDTSQPDDTDTATTPPIEQDDLDGFQGRVSPRVIDWILTELARLKTP